MAGWREGYSLYLRIRSSSNSVGLMFKPESADVKPKAEDMIIFYYILLSEEFQQDILFFHISLIDSLLFVAYDK